MRHQILFILLLLCAPFTQAQKLEKSSLIGDPIVGSVTQNSAKVWIAYKGKGDNIVNLIDTFDNTVFQPTTLEKIGNSKEDTAMVMTFTGLKPNHTYRTQIDQTNILPHHKATFTTQTDNDVRNMNFLFGSCALLNTDISRIFFPGYSSSIFWYMKRHRSDFMVWLGDNLYYLGKQATSYDRMFDRNLRIRRNFIYLQEFLATQPHYAIWDDHDYGWNDADKKFPLKDTALTIFKGFWPNTYYPSDTFKGNFFTFRYYDAEFFMTDNRYYRDGPGDTMGDYFGKAQVAWLKTKLKESNATFKFICTGSQVLNDSYYGESYASYPRERNDLFDFIAENNIPGVMFLTGDMHYTELSYREWKGYPFYDFTSSPLTSPVISWATLYKNNYSVPGTVVRKKNFGKISIDGPKDNRVLKMEIYNRYGRKKWERTLNAIDLVKKVK